MRVEADTEAQGPACRLVAEALGVEIAITGLTAGEMRYRLEGQGEPWRWRDLVERGPIGVSLVTDPIHEPVEEPPVVYETDLPDGRVKLVSGGEAEFRVEPRHADSVGILPYCFHAAVAQQLARAGVMTLHAAAIATSQGGLLAIGRKGAGKSTLTASALRSGFGVVTDDWLLASVDGSELRVERMRNFMMLRKGWATEQLRRYLPGDLVSESATRPRLHLWLPTDDPRFPVSIAIDRVCIVERPRGGRRNGTQTALMSASQSLGHFVRSSMPLVVSHQLPIERTCLFPRLSRAASLECRRLMTGTDFVDSSEEAWRSVLHDYSSAGNGASATVDRAERRC